ncbi:MAG: CAP domain-containing protein [Actinobacteria bacterium]|nr:CAP domain-containing protein [Actinomycetota bacterium]
MKKNLKNIIVFTATAIVVILVVSMSLAAAAPSAIEVKGSSVTQEQASTESVSKPQAALNDYENAVAALINSYRTASGLNAIAYEPTLTYIAKLRSQDMMDRGYFSHYSPEGTTVFNLMRANGITSKIRGENLGQAMPASIGSPEAFLNAWQNSSSHNANMLRVGYNYIGVGMVDNGDRIVVTTVFTN